jgi:sodium transport system ATP-binding protein
MVKIAPGIGSLMIEACELTKAYDDLRRGPLRAVDQVSFTVRAGEIFGLLGPNGAGKTTLLRILSTVLRPTSGEARIAGWDTCRDAIEVRRQIGFVSHNTAVYDRMSAWELIEYFGRLHDLPPRYLQTRMDELFEQLQMTSFRDAPCGKLSTGMKQKVSIARALVHDPPVLIFDEPTLGLDVVVARNLLEIIGSLRSAGKSILFSTHIMREVERLCDRVAILHGGKILDCGTLAELRRRHGREDMEDLLYQLLAPNTAKPRTAEAYR